MNNNETKIQTQIGNLIPKAILLTIMDFVSFIQLRIEKVEHKLLPCTNSMLKNICVLCVCG